MNSFSLCKDTGVILKNGKSLPPCELINLLNEGEIMAGLLFRLNKYGYIQTFDEESESDCDNLSSLSHDSVKRYQKL